MGFVLPQYILRSTSIDKKLQNLCHYRVVYTRSELAIGKGTGAALAKLHIARRVKLACAPKTAYVLNTPSHRLTTL